MLGWVLSLPPSRSIFLEIAYLPRLTLSLSNPLSLSLFIPLIPTLSNSLPAAGDKPELRWPEARRELSEMGLESTLDYVLLAAGEVYRRTGLLPHINAGVMGREDLRR